MQSFSTDRITFLVAVKLLNPTCTVCLGSGTYTALIHRNKYNVRLRLSSDERRTVPHTRARKELSPRLLLMRLLLFFSGEHLSPHVNVWLISLAPMRRTVITHLILKIHTD